MDLPKQRPERVNNPACLEGKYLPTSEDWYPNFERDTVECTLYALRDGTFRVCVWGADDTGMERDFKSLVLARHMYNWIPNPVTRSVLKDAGFVPG